MTEGNGSAVDFDKDLLKTRLTNLRAVVRDAKATPKKKLDTVLESEEIILMMISSDHPKVGLMWAVFRPMAWIMSAAILGIISLAVSGHITIAVTP
jgi:hypothetical protein